MRRSLESIPAQLPCRPAAILVVSAHWETEGFRVTRGTRPPLVYDYFNYPPEAYEIQFPALGDPLLTERVCELLTAADLPVSPDDRGLDHAVFIPLKVMFPQADIPVVALSLDARLDPETHRQAGAALAPLRAENVLIIGSGSSFHSRSRSADLAVAFDDWLREAIIDGVRRDEALRCWARAPGARHAHPREEHLLPLMVASGAALGEAGRTLAVDHVLGAPISSFAFG